MDTSEMHRLMDIQVIFTVSPDLDVKGFQDISYEITKSHPLYPQLVAALMRIDILIPDTGLYRIQREEIQKQVSGFYTVHMQDIERHCERTRKQWVQYKNQFLDTCDALFSQKIFIEDTEFIAYPTLWKVYIHQIKQHAFSFPLVEDTHTQHEAIYVVIHELLHVFFYQYVDTIPDLRKRNDLWDIAEIFNSIVLNQTRFKIFYPSHTITPYPVHKNIIKEVASSIADNDDADTIITRIIDYIG